MNALPVASSNTPAIRIHTLSKHFGTVTALDDISAQFPSGRLTGLVGPDGAGKTTLMRLLAGLMTPSAGRIEILGFDPRDQAHRPPDLVGYMPQRFGLYEDLSVIENLRLYADLQNLPRASRPRRFSEHARPKWAERVPRPSLRALLRPYPNGRDDRRPSPLPWRSF